MWCAGTVSGHLVGGKGSGRTPYKRFTANADDTERSWPKRNPACADLDLQDEVVDELHRLWDESLANLVVNGQPNPAIAEMEQIEQVAIDQGVILKTRQGSKSLLRMMAIGALNNR